MFKKFHENISKPEFLDTPGQEPKTGPNRTEYLVKHFYKTLTKNTNKDRVGYPEYLLNYAKP